jgi:ubiquinone/menaquinone biosynthesis C-methylase UbiE
MLMNKAETMVVSLPGRGLLQRHLELPLLLRMGNLTEAGHSLEVGCGTGTGVDAIFRVFGARYIDAFDLDKSLLQKAKGRLSKYGTRVRLWQGDVTEIATEDSIYDTVFDFAIVHHVPDWQNAVKEIYRVLKPGGMFYAEEVLDRFIFHPVLGYPFAHPRENRFNQASFIQELTNVGFTVIAAREFGGLFGWFVAQKLA